MFYIQCESTHSEEQQESDKDFNDFTETTPSNSQLLRMKKEVDNSMEDNHVDDIEHIEHIEQQHNIETLKDHIHRLNKIKYDNTNHNNHNNKMMNDNDEMNLLKSLLNYKELNFNFKNSQSNEQSTTFTFIEMIVQRTVNKYMNVIRTRSDWLKRLLQLVKEERDIRSRYNCFTDACIYKIQLFTTQLKAHLLRNIIHLEPIQRNDHGVMNLHMKRMKRSAIPESSTFTTSYGMNDSTSEILNDNPEIQDLLFLHDNTEDDDDALRLPNEVNRLNLIKQHEDEDSMTNNNSNNHNNHHNNNINNNNDGKHKSINFDNSNKIDVTRFSQELMNDVFLSKHIKSQTMNTSSSIDTMSTTATTTEATKTPTTTTTHNNVSSIMMTTLSIPIEQLHLTIDNQSHLLINNDINSIDHENIEDIHQNHDNEISINIIEHVTNISMNESNNLKNTMNNNEEKEREQLEEDLIDSTLFIDNEDNVNTSTFSTLSIEQQQQQQTTSSAQPIQTTTDLPISFNNDNQLSTLNSIDLTTDNLIELMNTTTTTSSSSSSSSSSSETVTTTPSTTSLTDIDQSKEIIHEHTIKPSLNIRAISLTIEETLAIPFGLNKFDGRPYENCTGQYENYCYNAIKCVYISVLETAACYCRTGYTGVRCDMFNLPQTLDILKSFREESIDINSLHQPTAYILHNVIEATARYTVNAVLEERLLSTWEDDTLF
ncbi:unnamed protein product [Schistosoma turkestanicum]|nr:unnamed protein product [Schistosoma turkestanicum]